MYGNPPVHGLGTPPCPNTPPPPYSFPPAKSRHAAPHSIPILAWNVRSLTGADVSPVDDDMAPASKADAIRSVCRDHAPAIIVLIETWHNREESLRFASALGRRWSPLSTDVSRHRGVLVLVDTKALHPPESVDISPDGWWVSADIRSKTTPARFRLHAVYTEASSPEAKVAHFSRMSSHLLNPNGLPVVAVGDWNAVENPVRDKPSSRAQPRVVSNALRAFLSEHALVEPADEVTLASHTCFSSFPNKPRRYDRWYVSSALLPFCSPPRVLPITHLSDHLPISVSVDQMAWTQTPPPSRCIITKSTICSPAGNAVIKGYLESYSHVRTPEQLCLLTTAIREALAPIQAARSRLLARRRGAARRLLEQATHSFSARPSPTTLAAYQAAQNRYTLLCAERDAEARERMGIKWDLGNELPSKFLTSLTRSAHTSRYISTLTAPDGSVVSGPDLLPHIESRFEKIYSCGRISPAHARNFDWSRLSSLNPEQASLLAAPFTEKEVAAAVYSIAPDKAPGPDGISPRLYREHTDLVVPILTRCYNHFVAFGSADPSFASGLVALVPKKVDTISAFDHIRPISLLNAPYKIMSAALATRLRAVISDLVHPLQTGYVPGRRIHSNLLIHDLVHRVSTTHATVLLDFSKAFDSMDHAFIDRTLASMKFPSFFRNAVAQMVSNAWAHVVVNGTVSETGFLVSSGTRQGDPVSGFLFILGMEVLATELRHSPLISGVHISPDNEVKYSMYCDDLTLYLANRPSLRSAFALIQDFALVSGMTVNVTKSYLDAPFPPPPGLPIPALPSHGDRLLGFTAVPRGLSESLDGPIRKAQDKLRSLQRAHLSLLGKKSAWAAYGLSQLTFFLFVLTPTKADLEELTSILLQFFFPNKTLVSARRLYAPKKEGGLGVLAPEVHELALKGSLLMTLAGEQSPLGVAINHYTATTPLAPPPWSRPRTVWPWLNRALRAVALTVTPVEDPLVFATKSRPHRMFVHFKSLWIELTKFTTRTFSVNDARYLRPTTPPDDLVPVPYDAVARVVSPAEAGLTKWLEVYSPPETPPSSSVLYNALLPKFNFLPSNIIPLPFSSLTPSKTLTYIFSSNLRPKLKEFSYLLSTNSLPIRVHRPCPLCNTPLTKSHLIKCSSIPPSPHTSITSSVFHFWGYWRVMNTLLHDQPPPISAHNLIQDPRDLELHKAMTFWPKYTPEWWKGTITNVNTESREFKIEYSKPYVSRATIPFDHYGWYIPYDKSDVAKWRSEAPTLASIFYSAELKRHELKLKKPDKRDEEIT